MDLSRVVRSGHVERKGNEDWEKMYAYVRGRAKQERDREQEGNVRELYIVHIGLAYASVESSCMEGMILSGIVRNNLG